VANQHDELWPINKLWPINNELWPINNELWPINNELWPINKLWPINNELWPINKLWPINMMSCGQSTSTRVQATSYIASITDGTGVFNAGASCNRQALAYAAAGSPKKTAKLAHKPLHGRKGKPPSYGVVSRTLPACARLAQAPKPCLQHTSAHIPSCLRSGTPV
jgi:hypothetical protein